MVTPPLRLRSISHFRTLGFASPLLLLHHSVTAAVCSGSAASPGLMQQLGEDEGKYLMVWMRKDVRFHDNEALATAVKDAKRYARRAGVQFHD